MLLTISFIHSVAINLTPSLFNNPMQFCRLDWFEHFERFQFEVPKELFNVLSNLKCQKSCSTCYHEETRSIYQHLVSIVNCTNFERLLARTGKKLFSQAQCVAHQQGTCLSWKTVNKPASIFPFLCSQLCKQVQRALVATLPAWTIGCKAQDSSSLKEMHALLSGWSLNRTWAINTEQRKKEATSFELCLDLFYNQETCKAQ
jgi:hypothetical protein